MEEALFWGHLRFLSLAWSLGSRLEDISCGKLILGNYRLCPVSHLPGKSYSHHFTDPGPQPKGGNYTDRGREKRNQRMGQGSQGTVRGASIMTSESSEIAPG
jgi:hypothetical protein